MAFTRPRKSIAVCPRHSSNIVAVKEPPMNPIVLQAENITKKFPGVIALKDVGFDLRAGEIHGLSGENGAGKSTLIKLLSGIYPYGSYEGNFFIHGQLAKFRSLADAQNAGVAVIYQELALVNDMTVGENIFLGSEPRTAAGLIDWHKVYHEARLLLQKFKVDIDPSKQVKKLGVGQKQLVEIVKALSKNSKILILDEPTAALAEHEVLILLDILRDLRGRGIASIYISHKLDEMFAICDRITVLRDGSSIATLDTKQTNKAEIIKHMVGREITDLFPRRRSTQGASALEIENLSVADPHSGERFLADINFSLRVGEILGIGGFIGGGRPELLMAFVCAMGRRFSGSLPVHWRELGARKPKKINRDWVGLV